MPSASWQQAFIRPKSRFCTQPPSGNHFLATCRCFSVQSSFVFLHALLPTFSNKLFWPGAGAFSSRLSGKRSSCQCTCRLRISNLAIPSRHDVHDRFLSTRRPCSTSLFRTTFTIEQQSPSSNAWTVSNGQTPMVLLALKMRQHVGAQFAEE